MKSIIRFKVALLAAITVVALALPSRAEEREEEVQFEDCPAAVQKTIKDHAGDGQIVEVEKETKKDGSVVYEAEVKRPSGKTFDIAVAEDGRLIEVEDDEDDDDDDDDVGDD